MSACKRLLDQKQGEADNGRRHVEEEKIDSDRKWREERKRISSRAFPLIKASQLTKAPYAKDS